MRIAPLLVALLLHMVPAHAAPPCTGALATSCAKKLFKCFKPKGTCLGELTFGPGTVQTIQCWPNGARITIDATMTGGTVEYRGARGKKCLRGMIVVEDADHAAFVYTKKKKRWTVRRTDDDGISITCPDGSTEQYTEAEVNAEPPSCGGYSDASACEMGDCP
jgi:hypothetical protein